MKITRFFSVFVLVLVLVVTGAAPPAQAVQQAGLDSGGDAVEVNHDGLGYLYVSDVTLGKIWQINTTDDDFQTFSISQSVHDAQMGSDNKIWWVNGEDSFGYVIPGNPVGRQWTLTSNSYYSIWTLAPDGQGGVWLGESEDPGRLFHFNFADRWFCQYDLPGGTYTHDMVYRSGYLWLSNWNAAQFYRILPDYGSDSISFVYWQEDYSGGGWGVDYDGKFLWWADWYLNSIGRLDPDQDLATYYHLPVGVQPVSIAADKGQVWYTEQFGQVGVLSPALAGGDDVYLDWNSGTAQGSCATLDIGTYPSIQLNYGTLSWEDTPVYINTDFNGWKIYELPDASPFGLAITNGSAWVSDNARDLLLRFETTGSLNIYIPLVFKH